MKKVLIALLAFVVLTVAALAAMLATFDVNKHRADIQAALSQQTGRSVKLAGDIHVGLSLDGVNLTVNDVSFGNPPWASREQMATIKKFSLGVGLMPLLSHKVDITGLTIEDADILVEVQNDYRRNWDSYQAGEATPAPKVDKKNPNQPPEAPLPIDISLTNVKIKNSTVGYMGPDRTITSFRADELTLGGEKGGLALHFMGSLNDQPVKLDVLSDAQSPFAQAQRPLDINLVFGVLSVTAKGKVDPAGKKAEFTQYVLSAGSSKIEGRLQADWGGARPVLRGLAAAENIDPADFAKPPAADSAAQTTAAGKATGAAPARVFSTDALPFGALKSVDALMDVMIAKIPAGSVDVRDLKAKVQLSAGRLAIAPMTMAIGKGAVTGQVNADAGVSPAKAAVSLAVNDVDISDLIKAWGAEAFLSGKVKADVNLAASGESMHDLASNLNGTIVLIGAGGDVISTASSKISAGLTELLSPGTGKSEAVNCMVARFIAQGGVVKGNGILIDTGAATAAGYGDIDLRSESINLDFHAKPKMVNVGGLLPPVHIGGTLAQPAVAADAKSVIQNVGSLLTGGTVADGVPDLQTQQGQNACVYTLDHPSASASSAAPQGGVVQDVAGKASTLIKGLFGK